MTVLLSSLMPSGITREIGLTPAWDKLNETPNYGIHNAEIVFTVHRGDCGVEWSFSTGWYLPKTRSRAPNAAMRQSGSTYENIRSPDGLGQIGPHSPVPLYEDQSPASHECSITGGDCYGGGSFAASGNLFDQVIEDPDLIWPELEKRLEELETLVKKEREEKRNNS